MGGDICSREGHDRLIKKKQDLADQDNDLKKFNNPETKYKQRCTLRTTTIEHNK